MKLYDKIKTSGITFQTTVPVGPAYIMEDGKFLSLITNTSSFRILGPYKPNHPELEIYLKEQKIIDNNEFNKNNFRTLLTSDNAVCLNDGTNLPGREGAYFQLPPEPITGKQYESLLRWLDYIMRNNESVDLEDTRKQQLYTYDFLKGDKLDGYLPDDIINNVKRIYNKASQKGLATAIYENAGEDRRVINIVDEGNEE